MKRTEAQAAAARLATFTPLSDVTWVQSATDVSHNLLPTGPAYYDNTGWHPAPAECGHDSCVFTKMSHCSITGVKRPVEI